MKQRGRPMKTALVALLAASLLAGGEAFAGTAPQVRPCDPVTGPITFKEKDSRRLGIRNPEGRIRTFTVDNVAMPHWFDEFQVGERVSVVCKDAGDERRPIATSLKAAPQDPAPHP
jgi:hypothetical protein